MEDLAHVCEFLHSAFGSLNKRKEVCVADQRLEVYCWTEDLNAAFQPDVLSRFCHNSVLFSLTATFPRLLVSLAIQVMNALRRGRWNDET